MALACALLAARASAGPALACPDGPDPLRFRPESAVAAVSADPEPLALATSVDPAGRAEWIALAYLTPAREIAVTLSSDGGCTFGALAPVVVSAAGAVITDRPSIALRVDGAATLLAVGWREGTTAKARASATLDGSFAPEVALDAAALGPPRLAIAPGGAAPLLLAAWRHDNAGIAVARVATTATGADAAAWSAPVDLRPAAAVDDVEAACDLAGAGGGPGCTILAALAGGEAHVARLDDPAGSWSAFRRVDDASSARLSQASLASSAGAGPGAWTALAWASSERAGGTSLDADAALVDAGALASDFDGVSASSNPSLAGGVAEARPAVAVGGAAPGSVAYAVLEQGGEVAVARRPLAAARPRLAGGCGPAQVTGLSPVRAAGAARAPVAAALGDDAVLAFVDDRSGAPEAFVKRADSVAPAVAITAANRSGCGAPPRVALQWSALPCDATQVVVEVGTAPGGTDFTRTLAPVGGVTVEGLEPDTAYYFRLRVTDSAGNEGVSAEATATTARCSDALIQPSLRRTIDACPSGGAGGDGQADPGETLLVTIRWFNAGTATATALNTRLQSRSGFVTVRTPPTNAGDVLPSTFADMSFEVDVSATAGCGPFELLARGDSGGAAWSRLVTLPSLAACTPCVMPGCAVTADASRTGPLEICAGAQVLLDAGASSAASCAGVLVHDWFDGAAYVGTGATVFVRPGASTTYRLASRCSTDFDCTGETTVAVVVNPLPDLAIVPDPPPPHCEGSTVTLRAVSADPTATFAWSDGSAGTSIPVTASGVFSATATNDKGCQVTRSLRVGFDPIPVADAGPDLAGCGVQRIGSLGYPTLDYEWSPATGLSDARAPQPFVAPGAPTTYTLTVTDPLTGCGSSDQVRVATTPGPGPLRALRVAKTALTLDVSWEALPGSSGVRVYADPDPARAAVASAASGAAPRCEGARSCSMSMPQDALLFVQAVGVCPDGSSEGPN